MATMEEVSARLMQPAKDLSDWNYPLAKVGTTIVADMIYYYIFFA